MLFRSDLSHHGGNAEKRLKLVKVDTFNTMQFAKFIEKLSKIQDGDATLLDRSIMMFGSSLSDGDMHSPLELPTVIAGGGNGTFRGNEHILYAPEKKMPMSNLFVTMLDKVGVNVKTVGDSTGAGVVHDLPRLALSPQNALDHPPPTTDIRHTQHTQHSTISIISMPPPPPRP